MDQYQQFIHKSRYARWMPEAKEEACRNTPFYGNCTFLITEEELDR